MSNNGRKFSIDKSSFMIKPDTIQAKTFPEIKNTYCWIVTNSRYIKKVWQKINGDVLEGMELCHKCDRVYGLCANPDHIFLGTHKQNMEDAVLKKRMHNGSCTESALKSYKTRIKNGTMNWVGSSESAKKAVQTKRSKGIKLNFEKLEFQKEMAKRSIKALEKAKENPNFHKIRSNNAKKGWKTRKKKAIINEKTNE